MGSGDRSSAHVTLLGGFRLFVENDQMSLSGGSERLLAFTALRGQAVPRNLIAGTLWPDTSEQRAYSSLRSALARLARLDGVGRKILDVGTTEIRLSPEVRVDFHGARALARRVLDPTVLTGEEDLSAKAVEALAGGLLPGWYDGWVLAEAEEWQQLRLHALEALTADFIMAGRFADAVAAAGVAVRAEPLRESACAALIRAHLAEGNQAEALRHFKRYERHLHEELALRPTPHLRELLAGLHVTMGR
jgi:SARP family transcriptional regulator, regulator of embCAB operon